METKPKYKSIPTPPKAPVVGNMLSLNLDAPLQNLMEMTRDLGPIFKLDMMGKPLIIASGHDIVDELCDENRFDKAVRGALRKVRGIAGDGLFTGETQEPNWQKAHNILLPTFGRQAMANYMPMMQDVAGQLVTKWERLNADDEIDVVHDMTAVALDTIGICGFDYRFNSFYRRDYHPFIDALNRSLETAMVQRGLPFEGAILRSRLNKMEADTVYMNKLVDDIIKERRASGAVANDLLNYMLKGVDKVTGESLSDENIRYQIITFLVAGHETTSGLMSFTLYYLMNHPDVLAKAYEEVDRVLGRDISTPPTLKQVNQLTYVQQILFEALRLWPTAPAFSVYPYQDEQLKSGHGIRKKNFVTVLSLMLHRDKSVWGENAEEFNPDNFTREAIAARPANAYKPFGNGQRACIGRQFAMQEATLIMGMILQRFELIDHTNYELKIKESLSIKPDGFKMKVRMRDGVTRSHLVPGAAIEEDTGANLATAADRPTHGAPALVLYGSNLGTTEDFARTIARDADANGFETTLAPLDDYAGKLPSEGAVLIACASYNGQPPDNAGKFLGWLSDAPDGAAEGVKFAVFGAGHSDWASTFQATPRTIDDALERLGGERIIDRFEADARDDIDDQFHGWVGDLFPEVAKALDLDVDLSGGSAAAPLYRVEVLDSVSDSLVDTSDALPVTITTNRELQNSDASGRSTRHIEVKLAEGMTYQTGDHLCVTPRNAIDLVKRVEARFGFGSDTQIKLSANTDGHSQLPTGRPISVRRLLTEALELQTVASRKDVQALAHHTECPRSKPALEALAGDGYRDGVFLKKLSALDILEAYPACEAPFAAFLEMCPLMAPRYYSISSSAKGDGGACSVTVGVVSEAAISGEGQFRGVCSNYLADLPVGATIMASLKETKANFRLPEDASKPVIMVGPGTGVAPFRGFLQERAIRKANGEGLGDAILFFGCRHPDQDFLYREELEKYAADGIADLRVAFSRKEKAKVYVQDLVREDRDKLWAMIEAGANIYICGDGGRMEPDVRRALSRIYSEEKDVSADVADAWIDKLVAEGRYNLDVWASN
ncbi:MAG: bifunctional cytochrome P450/NADPH--P450 reductase [Pikeienuella sp.]